MMKNFKNLRVRVTMVILIKCSILANIQLKAQSQNWWRVNGNTPGSSEFLGTTNNQPLLIRTNNITRFTFGSNGDIIFNSLGGGLANRVLSIDASGKLSALSGTAVSNLFTSNGVGVLTQTGNDYYLT